MRRRTLLLILALPVGLASAEVLSRFLGRAHPPPPPGPAPARIREFGDFLALLRIEAESGRDADLRHHADLLAAIAVAELGESSSTRVVHVPAIEAPLLAAPEARFAWATVAGFREEAADPERLACVFRSYDRYGEWTGQKDVVGFERDGDDAVVSVNGARTLAGMRIGPVWRFRVHPVRRTVAGEYEAWINVCTMVPWEKTAWVVESRGLQIAFRDAAGSRLVESAVSVWNKPIPNLLRGLIEKFSTSDLEARMEGLRHRWRELAPGCASR